MTTLDLSQAVIDGNRRLPLEDAKLLFSIALREEPKHLLEIGSADGCSSIILGTVAKKYGGVLQCIEPHPTGRWKGNIKKYELEDHVKMIVGSSPWISISELTLPIDFLFIDGVHKLKWVITDYQWSQIFVKQSGVIAFNDFSNTREDVREAVDIILRTDRLEEIARIETSRGLIIFRKS